MLKFLVELQECGLLEWDIIFSLVECMVNWEVFCPSSHFFCNFYVSCDESWKFGVNWVSQRCRMQLLGTLDDLSG